MAVAGLVVAVNVGGLGLDTDFLGGGGDGVCAKAAACCEVVAAGKESRKNCRNLKKLGVPEASCKSALEGFERSAKSMGKSCE